MRYMTYNLSMCWFLAVCPNQKIQWDIERTKNTLINIKITFTCDNFTRKEEGENTEYLLTMSKKSY